MTSNLENKSRWRTVQVPAVILEKIEKQIGQKNSNFMSISDFVTDCLRKEVERLKAN